VENNPYAPPKAAVADVEPTVADGLAFFAVSRTKLIVMSTATLTLYQIYWFYKNWACLRARGARAGLPLLRAIFAVFFCYSLFSRVRRHRDDLRSADLQAGLLALGWILLTVLSNLADSLLAPAGASWPFLVTLLGGYLSVVFLLPVQDAINEINRVERPDHDPNDRFTIWNALWITFGVALTLVGLSETFFPPP
jgi:hypothetical protein